MGSYERGTPAANVQGERGGRAREGGRRRLARSTYGLIHSSVPARSDDFSRGGPGWVPDLSQDGPVWDPRRVVERGGVMVGAGEVDPQD